MERPVDIVALDNAFVAVTEDVGRLTRGVDDPQGAWHARAGSWSVAECLDHLAAANRVYLDAMRPAAARARARGRLRRGPATPGLIGRWFVRMMEPPVKPALRGTAPEIIRPHGGTTLGDALRRFLASQDEVRAFLRTYEDLDLTGTRFVNPFVRGVQFSLATGLHVIAAHERRHIWQAWAVRRALERPAVA